MNDSDPPDDFKPLFRSSPVSELIGPIYCLGEGADLVLGLRVELKHCNARGTAHGGILATLADTALGYAMAFSTQPPTSLVTANLTLDFAGTAKVGDWLEAHVDVQKAGRRLAFANCYLLNGKQRVVRASAVFLVAGAQESADDAPTSPDRHRVE
jgi:acyl-coenzyme A thioesterase 13